MGHRQLLLRAQVFDENRFVKNVDVYFAGVSTISIPTTFYGIEIALKAHKKFSRYGYDRATISLLDLKTNKEHFIDTATIDVEENYCGNKSTIFLIGDNADEEYEKSRRCLVAHSF
jgi:hypothetical protein